MSEPSIKRAHRVILAQHKDYLISVFSLTPDPEFVEYEKTEDMDILSGDEIGNYGYQIYNQDEELVSEDLCCMGDEDACLENAKNEIRVLIEEADDE